MLDNQLNNIAVQDGHMLTPEAFQVLKMEIKYTFAKPELSDINL